MTSWKHALTTAALVGFIAMLVVFMAFGLRQNPKANRSVIIGQAASAFAVEQLQGPDGVATAGQGLKLDSAALKGKPLVLNFWASWCVSCRHEAKSLEAYWQKYREQIQVVGVATQDSAEDAMRFARAFGKTYVLGLDKEGGASIDYGVVGVPETFLVDREGVIRHKISGPVSVAMLEKLVAEYIL